MPAHVPVFAGESPCSQKANYLGRPSGRSFNRRDVESGESWRLLRVPTPGGNVRMRVFLSFRAHLTRRDSAEGKRCRFVHLPHLHAFARNSKGGNATQWKIREGEKRAATAYPSVQRRLARRGGRYVRERKGD